MYDILYQKVCDFWINCMRFWSKWMRFLAKMHSILDQNVWHFGPKCMIFSTKMYDIFDQNVWDFAPKYKIFDQMYEVLDYNVRDLTKIYKVLNYNIRDFWSKCMRYWIKMNEIVKTGTKILKYTLCFWMKYGKYLKKGHLCCIIGIIRILKLDFKTYLARKNYDILV